MSHVFGRSTRRTTPVIDRGEGCYLFDENGKQYLDGCGGAAVSCLGHNDKSVIAATQAQLTDMAYAHTGYFTSKPAETLAQKLASLAPGDIDKVYFVSGGSEANEAAIKLARQYFLEQGKTEKHRIIGRSQSYHGNTLGVLAAGGNAARRKPFLPLLAESHHIESCNAYRFQKSNESDEEYGLRSANLLEEKILELGPETVMAFIAEPVVGATAGALTAAPKYFERIRQICDQYDVLLILDEVMCGMGRTGFMFACEFDNVQPDIICIAKGLGAGYQPIGAMLCSQTIYDAIDQGSGSFMNGHTYMGHSAACAGSMAVLDAIINRDLLTNVRKMGQYLHDQLNTAFGQHPNIGDIRGRGLFQALEIIQDRASKTPFKRERNIAGVIKANAFELGLMCYPGQGTADGVDGDHILLAPPFIINPDQIDELVTKLQGAINSALQ